MKKIKPEIRILGIDDSPIEDKTKGENVRCIGTIYRGGNYIDGLLSFKIKKDGENATDKIIEAVNKTRHKDQLQIILIDGITLAGFNVVDINKIYQETGLAVIIVMRKEPNMKEFLEALKNIDDGKRAKIIEKTGKPEEIEINREKLYIQKAGINKTKIKEILLLTCINSNLPEPLRVAHLIASGIYYGESHGAA